jgi:hypothetical protein
MSTRPKATESQSVVAPDQQSVEEMFDPAAYFDQWLADLEATRKQLAAKARTASENVILDRSATLRVQTFE